MKFLTATIAISVIIFATLVLAASFNIDFLNLRETIPNTVALDAYLKVKAVNAWQFLNEKSLDLNPVIIGIIDTGVSTFHPEFEGVNFGNTPANARIDFGIFNSDTGKVETHGTNVAGIIGANNLSATSGANYIFPHMNGIVSGLANPSIDYTLEVRTIDFGDLGVTTLFSATRSIFDLANSDAETVNLSFAGSAFNPLAIPIFFSSFRAHPDITFVVAAGNNSSNAEFFVPAALGDNLDNVITVGATIDDGRTVDSNFGSAVNISAPGDAVFSPRFFTPPLDITGDYEFFGGTSASAPMVTGVAGILKALEPEYQKYTLGLQMTPAKIKEILIKSADPIFTNNPDEQSKLLGQGCSSESHRGCRLNAHRAVAWFFPPTPVTLNTPVVQSSLLGSPGLQALSPSQPQPQFPNTIRENFGTEFVFQNSQFPDLVLETSEPVSLMYVSKDDFVSYQLLEGVSSSPVTFTIKGLPPNTSFFLYLDSYLNEVQFATDSNGVFSYEQDTADIHSTWIQSARSTTIIDQDTTLTSDISGSVEIIADNVMLDCNGHSIIGSDFGIGIKFNQRSNVTVKNCTITNFFRGIEFFGRQNSQFIDNTITNNGDGFVVFFADGNQLTGNIITNNSGFGLITIQSGSHTLQNNQFSSNGANLSVDTPRFSPHSIDATNTVEGKPVLYLVGQSNITITDASNIGYLGIVNSSNITVRDTTLPSKNGQGVLIAFSSNITVENITVSGNVEGIDVTRSSSVTVSNSQISGNSTGIGSLGASNILVEGNSVSGSGFNGIQLSGLGHRVFNNTLANNSTGIFTFFGRNYQIKGNTITNSSVRAVGLFFDRDNTVEDNTFENNQLGVFLVDSENDLVFHNNFINNTTQVEVIPGSGNRFDNGSGGNHWSDFDEPAEGCSDTNNDGICDAPRPVPAGNTDNFPFVNRDGWKVPQVVDVQLTWSKNEDPDFGSYRIFRSTVSPVTLTSTLVTTITSSNTLTFTDPNLSPGQTFFYKVFVFDGAGLSSGSNERNITP